MAKALALLSGGPDSATLLKWARGQADINELHALYLKGGHATDAQEIECADFQAHSNAAKLEIIDISQLVAGLGGQRILVHSEATIMPFGNATVLSLSTTYALLIGADRVLIGLHKDDADESVEYTRAFIDHLQSLTQSVHPEISYVTPFIEFRKAAVIAEGGRLGVDFAKTWSCIRPESVHCGYCGACRSRAAAFQAAQLTDPTVYTQKPIALTSTGSH
jgi:7-cyano-7-deazaguanine synthase